MKILNKFRRITITAIELKDRCYYASRSQYNARCLFKALKEAQELILIIINQDMYLGQLNFVFGTAFLGRGAVVSAYRLEDDKVFLRKECIHELGHVFGLRHGSLPCVMTFSNSVYEAKHKSSKFCDSCQEKLRKSLS